MCFKNLPIEFDAEGRAHLIKGVANPYQYQSVSLEERDRKLKEFAKKNGQTRDIDFDPVTRVAGVLAFHSTVDLKNRRVIDTRSMATLFRGYEVSMRCATTSPTPTTRRRCGRWRCSSGSGACRPWWR